MNKIENINPYRLREGIYVLECHTDWTATDGDIRYRRGQLVIGYLKTPLHNTPWEIQTENKMTGRAIKHYMSTEWMLKIFVVPADLQALSDPSETNTQEQMQAKIDTLVRWVDKINHRRPKPGSPLARHRDAAQARINCLQMVLDGEIHV